MTVDTVTTVTLKTPLSLRRRYGGDVDVRYSYIDQHYNLHRIEIAPRFDWPEISKHGGHKFQTIYYLPPGFEYPSAITLECVTCAQYAVNAQAPGAIILAIKTLNRFTWADLARHRDHNHRKGNDHHPFFKVMHYGNRLVAVGCLCGEIFQIVEKTPDVSAREIVIVLRDWHRSSHPSTTTIFNASQKSKQK